MELKDKLRSRKFWAMVFLVAAGVIVGTNGVLAGDKTQVDAGTTMCIAGVVGYFAAEGFADGMGALANKSTISTTTQKTITASSNDKAVVQNVLASESANLQMDSKQ